MNDVRDQVEDASSGTLNEADQFEPATTHGAAVDDTGAVVELDETSEAKVPLDDSADPDGLVPDAPPAVEPVATGDSGEDDEDGDDNENPLESEAEIAADYLEELLDIADLDGDIDTYIEGDRAHVSIVSQSDVLVGPDGRVLDALQELTRLAVMTETGDRSRLMLDVAGYRERRRQELVVLASDAVQEVRDSGNRVSLAPMNPFERKIVHDAVAAAGLTSESEGEEPKRHVVVVPVS